MSFFKLFQKKPKKFHIPIIFGEEGEAGFEALVESLRTINAALVTVTDPESMVECVVEHVPCVWVDGFFYAQKTSVPLLDFLKEHANKERERI